jgi:hypothetical protein
VPFTFLSHQGPVLGLKVLAPHWVDGTALAIGSMAPDLVFILGGTRFAIDAHRWGAQLTVCLPLTLVLCLVTRKVLAPTVPAHLPDAGRFHLRDYDRLADWTLTPRTVAVAAVSGLVGSASHVALDEFTHGFGWGVARLPALRRVVFELPDLLSQRPVHVYDILQLAATVAGAAAAICALAYIGHRRLIRRWHPNPQHLPSSTTVSRSRFRRAWRVSATAAAGLSLATIGVGGPQHAIVRTALLLSLATLTAGVLARPTME